VSVARMILALGKTWPSALQRFLQVAGALNPSQRAAGMRILDPDSPCCRRTTVWRWRADRRHALTPIGIQARPAAQALRCSATLRNSGLEQRKTHTVEGSRLDADQGRIASSRMLPKKCCHDWGGAGESDRWRPWRGTSAWARGARWCRRWWSATDRRGGVRRAGFSTS